MVMVVMMVVIDDDVDGDDDDGFDLSELLLKFCRFLLGLPTFCDHSCVLPEDNDADDSDQDDDDHEDVDIDDLFEPCYFATTLLFM